MSGQDDEPVGEGGYRLDEQIGFILRKAHQRHVALFARHIADLTPQQFAALAKLRDIGPTSQNQLGSLIAMDAATVKGVIDRLAARGYVTTHRDDGDRRRLVVGLSPAGKDAVERLTPLARCISEETLSPLKPSEVGILRKLLARLT